MHNHFKHQIKELDSLPKRERHQKAILLLKTLSSEEQKLLLGCACHWGDVKLAETILKKEPTWINEPILVGDLTKDLPYLRLFAQNSPVPPLIHALRNGHLPLVKKLLSYPDIITDSNRLEFKKFGWTLLGWVINSRDLNQDNKKFKIVEALMNHGVNPLEVLSSDSELSCAMTSAIDELELDILKLLCKPPFKWNAVSSEQCQKINNSIASQLEDIDYQISFHEDESSINSQTRYDFLKTLIEIHLPIEQFPAFKSVIEKNPELESEYLKNKFNNAISKSTVSKSRKTSKSRI